MCVARSAAGRLRFGVRAGEAEGASRVPRSRCASATVNETTNTPRRRAVCAAPLAARRLRGVGCANSVRLKRVGVPERPPCALHAPARVANTANSAFFLFFPPFAPPRARRRVTRPARACIRAGRPRSAPPRVPWRRAGRAPRCRYRALRATKERPTAPPRDPNRRPLAPAACAPLGNDPAPRRAVCAAHDDDIGVLRELVGWVGRGMVRSSRGTQVSCAAAGRPAVGAEPPTAAVRSPRS